MMTVAMGKTRKNRRYLKHAGAVCYNDDNAPCNLQASDATKGGCLLDVPLCSPCRCPADSRTDTWLARRSARGAIPGFPCASILLTNHVSDRLGRVHQCYVRQSCSTIKTEHFPPVGGLLNGGSTQPFVHLYSMWIAYSYLQAHLIAYRALVTVCHGRLLGGV